MLDKTYGRWLTALSAGSLLAVIFVAPAFAAGPMNAPAAVRAVESFESAPVPGWEIRPFNLVPPATASWGISGLKYSAGTKSLWCAGTSTNTGTTYLSGTAGYAEWDLPELAEYYSAELSFKYIMPSLGRADANSFNVGWSEIGGSRVQPNYGFPLTSSWQQRVFDISDPAYLVNVSREPGYVYFQFIDFSEGPEQSPKFGEGAFVDEVVVKGYKYGPVRALAAVSDAGVRLNWSAPHSTRTSTTADTRPIVYRIWRALDDGQTPVWVELAGSGTTSRTITDAGALAGVPYTYAVQAWESATSGGYGQAVEVKGRLESPVMDLSISAPDAVRKNTSASITYSVTNTSEGAIGPVTLEDNLGTSLDDIPSIAAGATVPRTFTHLLSADQSLSATASAASATAVATRHIKVVDPKLTVVAVPSVATVEVGAAFHVDYTVTNTGDIDLTNVIVTDQNDAEIGRIPVLASAGAPVTLTVNHTAQATQTFGASVTGAWTYLSAGGPITATATDVLVTVVGVSAPPARIAGTTRTATAVSLSKEAFPDPLDGDRAVVLASGYGWADALPASALAGAIDGPLLLTAKDSVPAEVTTELKRLGTVKVYIVGGEAVVAPAVKTQLEASGLTVERVSGATRYETSEKIARKVQALDPGAGDTVFIATGVNFPDALAASSLAAKTHHPILLTRKEALPTETKAALAFLDPSKAYVLGGIGAVSAAVQADLELNYTPLSQRLDGATRYDTALKIINEGKSLTATFAPAGIFLATGVNFPDALAGGVLAGIGEASWRPLMLTTPTTLSAQAATFITGNSSLQYVSVIGGTSAISQTVYTQASQLLQ